MPAPRDAAVRTSRRALLVALASSAVAIGAGLQRLAGDTTASGRPPRSAPAGVDPDPMVALGQAYLEDHPGEGLDELRRAVPAVAGATDRTGVRAALPAVRSVASRDFAADRTVLVGGWLLAASEARAAAVAALLPA